jgi:hypothetical protein
LVNLILLVSGLADHFEAHMGWERYAAFISLFEKCLLLEHFLQADMLTRESVQLMREYISSLMDLFKRTIHRQTGMGCKFIKFHLLLHLADDLERNGSCQNTTSGPGESRHKIACKRPAKNTQRIAETFDEQVAKNYSDAIAIERAFDEVYKIKDKKIKEKEEVRYQGKRFCFVEGNLLDYKIVLKKGEYDLAKKWFDTDLYESVTFFLKNFVSPKLDSSSTIDCYTECYCKDTLIRANPMFKNKRAWNDWIFVDFEDIGKIAIQIILFLEIKGMDESIQGINGSFEIAKDGFYALSHYIPVPLTEKPVNLSYGDNHKAHQASLLLEYSQKKMVKINKKQQPDLLLVDMNKMLSPCIAVPDLDSKEKHSFIFLKSKSDWLPIFIQHMKDPNEDGSMEFINGDTLGINDDSAVDCGQSSNEDETSEDSSN